MKIPRAHVLVFIGLLFVFCIGCAQDEYGGCYCPSHHYVKVGYLPSTSQVNQSANNNIWQNADNLGLNKTPSGVSARNMVEGSSSRDDRRDSNRSN